MIFCIFIRFILLFGQDFFLFLSVLLGESSDDGFSEYQAVIFATFPSTPVCLLCPVSLQKPEVIDSGNDALMGVRFNVFLAPFLLQGKHTMLAKRAQKVYL